MSVNGRFKTALAMILIYVAFNASIYIFVSSRGIPFMKGVFLAVVILAVSTPWYIYLSKPLEEHYIDLLVIKEPTYTMTATGLIMIMLMRTVFHFIFKVDDGVIFGLNAAILLFGLFAMSFSLTRLMRMYHCLIARIDNKLDLGDATSDEKILDYFYALSAPANRQTGGICVFGFIAFAGFFFFRFVLPYSSQYNEFIAAYFILGFFIICNGLVSANRTIVTNVITFMTIMKCDVVSAEKERLRELLRGQLAFTKGMVFMYLVLCIAVFYMISALM